MTTHVDYASELAHQKLSNVAHELARVLGVFDSRLKLVEA